MPNKLLAPDDVLAALAQALSVKVGYRHTASGVPVTTGMLHGPNGILTYPGVEPELFSTFLHTESGLIGQLQTRASVVLDPVYEVFTGITDASEALQPDGACDDPPSFGLMKAGKITAPFGHYKGRTVELNLADMGGINNRADPLDLRILGNTQGGDDAFPAPGGNVNPIANEMNKRLWERAMGLHYILAKEIWNGNPALNAGADRHIAGLTQLVTTGYVDAETNLSLPSLDSDVKDFTYRCVETNGAALVQYITAMFRYLRSKSRRQRVEPVRYLGACRENLFYAIAGEWPCAYYTGGCTVVDAANGQTMQLNATDVTTLRDQMRQQQFLLIDGMKLDVVFDDAIDEENANNQGQLAPGSFASDFYILPMSVLGGTSTLYLDYFDYGNASISAALAQGLDGVRVSGAWMEWTARKNTCFWFGCEIKPRLVLRTPWLAGRLKHICYTPLQHTPDAFPQDPYHQNGGDSVGRPGASLYAVYKG